MNYDVMIVLYVIYFNIVFLSNYFLTSFCPRTFQKLFFAVPLKALRYKYYYV